MKSIASGTDIFTGRYDGRDNGAGCHLGGAGWSAEAHRCAPADSATFRSRLRVEILRIGQENRLYGRNIPFKVKTAFN
jgi:hypothetical protein